MGQGCILGPKLNYVGAKSNPLMIKELHPSGKAQFRGPM